MTTTSRWAALADRVLAPDHPLPTRDEARAVLHAPVADTLALLDAAFRVRQAHWGLRVSLHVLDNAKLGACPEDCGFCSQSSRHAGADGQVQASPAGEAPMKSVDELVEGARRAHAARAKRYCMVTATRGPSARDLDTVCAAAERIKAELDIELCASLGILTEAKAARLAAAGVDRFNHNLETSERYYDQVVSTHRWADRVETVRLAKAAGMDTCCGGIVGLGESDDDLLDLAFTLRQLDVDSVPVNFLDARPGTPMAGRAAVSPGAALRALCMMRFVHPRTDLRVAGGRELTLRGLQVLALYPANSIFTQGYLTTDGASPAADHQLIADAGFELELADGHTEAPDPVAVAAVRAPRKPSLPQVAPASGPVGPGARS
ncbi:MAG: biotin synthase BioB [Kofleriaceae bacterium]|jgi:biotin synthase|nr:biotin synthase BioB [Kofleriaceae bacterium]MBP6837812.1 biotin synthase BioB [Kofleriaceae bacterium]